MILFFILHVAVIFAQKDSQTNLRIGTELDALPYISGGYYFSGWVGYEKLRLRAVLTNVKTPEFVIPSGFKDLETDAYTLLIDYFPTTTENEYEKWWIGLGMEYWENSVVNSSNNANGKYDNLIITLGGGYVWKIYKNLYLNPWIAGHLPITGTSNLNIGGKIYEPKKFLYEASLKIGWYF